MINEEQERPPIPLGAVEEVWLVKLATAHSHRLSLLNDNPPVRTMKA